MIPKSAIEKAIGGGWRGINTDPEGTNLWQKYALDPTFWQALEKSCTWGATTNWKQKAFRFYDLILTGGSTDEFWDDLLTNKPPL